MPAARLLRLPFPAFCGVSIFAGCAGLRFIPHYFVLTLPAVGMVIGLGVVEAAGFYQTRGSSPSLPICLRLSFVSSALVSYSPTASTFQRRSR